MQENRNGKITRLDDYRNAQSNSRARRVSARNVEPRRDERVSRDKSIRTRIKQPKGKQVDFMLMCLVVSLVLFGLVMIFSASYYSAIDRYSDMFYFLKRQGMWIVLSTFAMIVFMNISYRFWKKLSVIAYIGSIGLLSVVLALGAVTKGAQRWLTLAGANIQPSEFAKVAMILFLAYILSKKEEGHLTKKEVGRYMLALTVPFVLIFIENFSTAFVFMGIGLVMLIIRNVGVKWIYALAGLCVAGYILIYAAVPGMELTKYVPDKYKQRINRIEVWFNPWSDPRGDGYQTIQSLYAIGSGGVFGLGIGQSRQKLGYIPEAHNDIIFSIICEELGLVGATILILVFITLIWKGIKVSVRAPDLYSSLVAAGITTMIALQVIINIAVVTNTIPVTGMPLPFISYGGSSLLTLMISMGILLNISRYEKE